MTTRRIIGIVLATNAGIIAALLLALWAASTVAAVPSPAEQQGMPRAEWSSPAHAEPTPVPGGPGYYSISSGEMQPTDYTIGYQSAAGWLTTTQESTLRDATLYASGLHLPQGARITKLVVYGYDDDPSADFWFRAAGVGLDGDVVIQGVTDVTYSDTSAGAFVAQVAANDGHNIVDNSIYQYLVIAHLPVASSEKRLNIMGFRVDYTFDSYAPLVMKEH